MAAQELHHFILDENMTPCYQHCRLYSMKCLQNSTAEQPHSAQSVLLIIPCLKKPTTSLLGLLFAQGEHADSKGKQPWSPLEARATGALLLTAVTSSDTCSLEVPVLCSDTSHLATCSNHLNLWGISGKGHDFGSGALLTLSFITSRNIRQKRNGQNIVCKSLNLWKSVARLRRENRIYRENSLYFLEIGQLSLSLVDALSNNLQVMYSANCLSLRKKYVSVKLTTLNYMIYIFPSVKLFKM